MLTTNDYLEAHHDPFSGMVDGDQLQQRLEADSCTDSMISHVMRAATRYNDETRALDAERLERAIYAAHCEAANEAALAEIEAMERGLLITVLAAIAGIL
jgi:hypothetical protein